MEAWQRRVIQLNLPDLIRDTQCNKTLLAILFSKELISHEERIKIGVIKSPIDKADFLYKIIVTRKNGYEELLKASRIVKQSGVSHILEHGERNLYLFDAFNECNVRDFRCQRADDIDFYGFHGISTAIAEYVDVQKFQPGFKTETFLLRGPKNETYLHVAAAYGYVKLIDYLIEKGLQIRTCDDEGQTPGHYIGEFSTNILEILKTLMKHGLDVRQTNDNGLSIVSTVALYGKINQYHYHHLVDYIINMEHEDVFTLKCKEGATPLHHALEMLELEKETIHLILKSTKMNINLADNLGRIPLHWALMHGRSLTTIKVLIELGADFKVKDGKKEGALHFAVKGSNKKAVGFLVSFKMDINEVDTLGETPIHKVRFTKSRDFLGMTKFLLDIGANLSAKDKNGNNVAHLFALTTSISSYDFHAWTEEMVYVRNSQVFAERNHYGETPLQIAIKRLDLDKNTIQMMRKVSKVDIIQPNDDVDTLLFLALQSGRSLETIQSLISLGSNIKTKKIHWIEILNLAVIGGNKEVIQYLISQGLNVNEKNIYGYTSIHAVSQTRRKNYVELTKLLVENGADLYSEITFGGTLAHEMATSQEVSCDDFKIWVNAMIEDGHARLFTIRGLWGRTPLHYSMERWDLDLETMKLLIEYAKLDINRLYHEDDTILHTALEYGRSLETIKNLVELGADWNKKGQYGRSVLHFAVSGSNKEAFLYFKSLGADVNAKDWDGRTPLHYVTWTRNRDYLGMTTLLLENGAKINTKSKDGRTFDQLMLSYWKINAEEYGMWKEGMIKLGHQSIFKKESLMTRLFDFINL